MGRYKSWSWIPGVVGENYPGDLTYRKSKIRQFAEYNRRHPTPAERELKKILNTLNGGVLRGKFHTQHVASGKWILDFFFPEIRLGIEVDGSFHALPDQISKDRQKEIDCKRFDITLLRVSNSEVFGPRNILVEKLRYGWRSALQNDYQIIGQPVVK